MICTDNIAKGVVLKEQLQITFQNKPRRTVPSPMAPYDMCLHSSTAPSSGRKKSNSVPLMYIKYKPSSMLANTPHNNPAKFGSDMWHGAVCGDRTHRHTHRHTHTQTDTHTPWVIVVG